MSEQEVVHEVKLAIYDLSQGMARSLSAQFLGPDFVIDIIPHTGILVYGKEYFYGSSASGGIAAEDPSHFRATRGLRPIRIETLGRTGASQEEFETWCVQQNRSKYRGTNYDLLQNNCNNFSHDAARKGLRLANGVPQWILDVPQRFLASPMGQLVRPMLDNMQLAAGNAAGFAPTPTPQQSATAATHNPWANNGSSSSSTTTMTAAPTTKSASNTARPTGATQHKDTKPKSKETQKTPMLDSYNKFLLSSDTKTAPLCAKKLGNSKELQEATAAIQSKSSLSTEQLDAVAKTLMENFLVGQNLVFGLMLLRLLVLQQSTSKSIEECLDWIAKELTSGKVDAVLQQSQPARSMAWCTASNAYAMSARESLKPLCEAAIVDIATARKEVKQAAVTFLYNLAMAETVSETVSDLQVSLLCSCLDSLAEEDDDVTKLRRLLVAGRLLKPIGSDSISSSVRTLIKDLGLDDVIGEVAAGNGDTAKLATEIQQLL